MVWCCSARCRGVTAWYNTGAGYSILYRTGSHVQLVYSNSLYCRGYQTRLTSLKTKYVSDWFQYFTGLNYLQIAFKLHQLQLSSFFLKGIFTNFPHKMFRFTATISLCFQQVEITPAFSIVNVLTLSTLANNAQDDLQRRSPGVSFQYFSQITISLEISLFSWWGGWPSWLGQYYDYSGSLLKWRWIHLLKADYKINDV